MSAQAAPLPSMIYGTAWKGDATAELVHKAIRAGFRALDTANQKKHYREDLVGEPLRRLAGEGIAREALFLQSKFTHARAQDHRLPYNPSDDFGTQVQASFASTLQNLGTDHLDAYLLHGPSSNRGLTDGDRQVWRAMEDLQRSGRVRMLGVSNVELHHLLELIAFADVGPAIVQNRCYAAYGWDQEVREYCYDNGIVYQGFSLLTANRYVVRAPVVTELAERYGVEPAQIVLRFSQQIGILPLTGTTNEQHMADDLRVSAFELPIEALAEIAALPESTERD